MPGLAQLMGTGSYNGLTWGGGVEGAEYPVQLMEITGLEDMPDVRKSDADRPLTHGSLQGIDLLAGRTITAKFQVLAPDNPTYYAFVAAIETATGPRVTGELPLLLLNSSRLVFCRPRRRKVEYDAAYPMRVGNVSVEFFASDPRVYDAALTSLSVGLPPLTGGLTFPLHFPLSFGATGVGGSVDCLNVGNFAARPIITFTGPVSNPRVQNVTSGQTLKFGIVLGVGETLTVDTDMRSVILNDTASRRATLTPDSKWWELAPGTSQVTFRADAYSAGASMQIAYRSAWA